jgi:outer membrane protein assembly factor BamD (BamD/ComL family)
MNKNLLLIFLISLLTLACNTHKDKDLFDSAEKNYIAKNYPQALIEYQQIINEYSSSDYAEKSLLKVGSMYQMFLVPKMSAEESNQKAVEYYRRLFRDFPKSAEAPKVIFMAGFLLANDLKKYDEANLAYKTFLQKFPNDPLAPQVKIELENMGKSPEEILQSKITTK